MTPLELILGKLPHHRKLSDSMYEARCPGHDDSGFTLAVGLRDDGRPELWCRNGCRHEDLLRELELGPRDAVDHFEEAPASSPVVKPGAESFFESGASFLERARQAPDIGWLIPDLVPDIGSVLIIGEPNAGKSWLAFLACAVASRGGREVFIVEEEGLIRRIGWRLEVLGVEPSHLHVAHLRQFLIDDREKRRRVFSELRAHERPVVMFDPLTSIHQGDENSTKDANTVGLIRSRGQS